MMTCRNFRKAALFLHHGFTMIETIVALAVLGMFFASVGIILQGVLENIGSSRVRATALALAQQKMEVVRNLSYANVGTVGGIPQGTLAQTEQITINGLIFTVKTSVIYIDDPFDGVMPADLINTDYKRARVEVTWGGAYPSRAPLALVTNIVPKGIESIAGGGTLLIQVFNGGGLPVSNANITIDNTAVTPAIHMQTLTNTDGLVVIPGAPSCITCYKITVTKQNYSTDKTYSSAEVANPLQPEVTVIAGNLTQLSFAIDEVSTLVVNSYNTSNQPVANVIFTIHGSKLIGHDTNDIPVYKYQYSTNTGGGTVAIPGLEWDTYTLDLTNSYHTIAGSNPTIPFALLPATTLNLPIIAVPKTNISLQVTVKNSSGLLQSSASATLSNTILGYMDTQVTPGTGSANFGQVYFGGLSFGTYALKVSLPGYQEATASIPLSTNQQDTVTLNIYVP
jgi:prepilin-type N-terminal cleavage/methylation domain-containing protein